MKKFKKLISIIMSVILSLQSVNGVNTSSKVTSSSKNTKFKIIAGVAGMLNLTGTAAAIGIPAAILIKKYYDRNKPNQTKTPQIIDTSNPVDFSPDPYLQANYSNFDLAVSCLEVNDKFKQQDKSMQRLTISIIDQIFRGVPKLYYMNKKVFGKLTFNIVDSMDKNNNLRQKTQNRIISCYENSNVISFRSDWFKLENNSNNSLKDTLCKNFPEDLQKHLKNNSPLGLILSHEMGHMFFFVFERYIRESVLKNRNNTQICSIDYWKQRILEIAQTKYFCYDTKITDYGEQDSGEWFAELFSATVCGGLKGSYPLCMALWDFINEITANIN